MSHRLKGGVFFRSRTKWLNICGSNFSTQNFQVMVTGVDASPHYLTTQSLVESLILPNRRQKDVDSLLCLVLVRVTERMGGHMLVNKGKKLPWE